MMENNKKESGRFHEVIKTKPVFTEDNQVFMRKEVEGIFSEGVPEWFPTNFNWTPVRT